MAHRDEFRARAQTLRRELTREERHLWYDFLKSYPVQFKRQVVFGNYIVDFYCPKAKLVIELDGSQHYEGSGLERDRQRSRYLSQTCHVEILRFTNLEIKQNFEGVCLQIDQVVTRRLPPSGICSANATSPLGGG